MAIFALLSILLFIVVPTTASENNNLEPLPYSPSDQSAAASATGDPSTPTLLEPDREAVTKNTQHDDYQVMLFYRRANRMATPDMPNITLVSHATIDRLPHVARWCRTLRGPMSISIFVRPVVDDVAAVMGAFAADECVARHADLHLVSERGHRYDASVASGEGGKDMMTHYPFNVQRNAALDGCVGALALLMDIDFHLMPMPNNREVDLRRHLEAQRSKVASWSFLADEPWVLDAALYVIPAVETMNKEVALPRTLSELRTGVETHSVLAFYHTCQTCHRPTDLRKFLRHASDPYLVQFEEGYEPYVIVNRSSTTPHTPQQHGVPRYDEVFVGRGWDKMSFFYELAIGQQRPFIVLPHYFLTHHGKGDMPKFLTTEYMRRQEVNRALMGRFKEDMAEKYGTVGSSTNSGNNAHGGQPREAVSAAAGASHSLGDGGDHVAGVSASSTCVGGGVAADECTRRVAPPPSASDGDGAAPVVVQDELLWRATEGIDWSLVDTTLGFPVMCLCRIRRDGDVAPSDVTALEDILTRVCHSDVHNHGGDDDGGGGANGDASSGLNCSAVQQHDGVRSVPASIVRRADWVFDRAFHYALSRGADAAEACDFGGYGVLVAPSDPSASSAEAYEDPLSFGCTFNRDACVPLSDVHRLLRALCGAEMARDGGSSRDVDAEEAEADDRLGGGCAPLFARMHPLVRGDPRMQLAVALNAHHAAFHRLPRTLPPPTPDAHGGWAPFVMVDAYPTCRRRWGPAAASVKRPENVQWARPH